MWLTIVRIGYFPYDVNQRIYHPNLPTSETEFSSTVRSSRALPSEGEDIHSLVRW